MKAASPQFGHDAEQCHVEVAAQIPASVVNQVSRQFIPEIFVRFGPIVHGFLRSHVVHMRIADGDLIDGLGFILLIFNVTRGYSSATADFEIPHLCSGYHDPGKSHPFLLRSVCFAIVLRLE